MKSTTTARKLFCSVAALTCISMTSFAHAMAQSCALGDTCPLPGNDGGETYFVVSPSSGTDYICEVRSKGDSMKFLVSSGKHFKILSGGGYYNANQEATVDVRGRFKNPDDPNDSGQIKFSHVPLTAEGSVKCQPKK